MFLESSTILKKSHDELLSEALTQVKQIHAKGQTPAVYTSREELTFSDKQTRLAFGEAVSTLLMDIVKGLPDDIGFFDQQRRHHL